MTQRNWNLQIGPAIAHMTDLTIPVKLPTRFVGDADPLVGPPQRTFNTGMGPIRAKGFYPGTESPLFRGGGRVGGGNRNDSEQRRPGGGGLRDLVNTAAGTAAGVYIGERMLGGRKGPLSGPQQPRPLNGGGWGPDTPTPLQRGPQAPLPSGSAAPLGPVRSGTVSILDRIAQRNS